MQIKCYLKKLPVNYIFCNLVSIQYAYQFYTGMKIYFLVIPFLLFGFAGCAQKDDHNFHMPGKIPIDAKRWYQLSNTTNGLDKLFDNNQYQKPNTGYHKLIENYDAWYPLLEGEEMTIDSIMMFCNSCIDASHPLTIYTIDKNWQKTPVAVFKGARYNTWEGPDPGKSGVFALPKPLSGFRYIVINSWGEFPAEMEFYGKYTRPATVTPMTRKPIALGNYFGINAYEWNFENEKNPNQPDSARLNAIRNFAGVRHYLDWGKIEKAEGRYTYNPVPDGGWNYDAMYQWCADQHIEVLACLKTIPKWMEETYPEGHRNYENIPVRYGKDLADPASYIEQAKMGFQYAARYGGNKNVDIKLLSVDATPRWNGDKVNVVKTGLGLIKYVECDNERDKWWKGRTAYQTGREYAANMSAFYDGNKGKLGPGVGVKTADPDMKVVMGGLSNPSTGYIMGMIDWCKQYRGYKPDGAVDLPWDIINYHYYANDNNKEQTTGVAPEMTSTAKVAEEFMLFAHRFTNDMPVWVTEAGYDINQQSPQRAPAINNKTAEEVQADWLLRTSLLYARCGIQRVFYYQLYDDNPNSTTKFGTSGLINIDRTGRPAADYMYQVKRMFGAYTYTETISKDPAVDKYSWNGKTMYALWVPDAKNRTTAYQLDLGKADTAYIYKPKAGKQPELTKTKTTNGKVQIVVSETPVFVTGYEIGK